jgi:MFS family permease
MVVLDNLIVASTMPSIQRTLGGSLGTLQWVLDAYILAFAVLMLTATALGERFGRRRIFIIGVLLFTGASAAGGFAPSVGVLVAARAVQGMGGAMITPLTLTLLSSAFPAERRAAALGAWSAIPAAGVALGPIVGGLLTDVLSWHWIFWVNLPIGVVVALVPAGPDREPRSPRGQRRGRAGTRQRRVARDRVGDRPGQRDRLGLADDPRRLRRRRPAAGGLRLLESRVEHPMIPPRLFESRAFVAANLANLLLSFGMFAAFLMVVQFLQNVRGEAPVRSGMHSLAWTAMPMIVSPLASRLGRRVAPMAVVTAGCAVVARGVAALAIATTPETDPLALAPLLALIGIAIGLVIPNLAAAAMGAVPAADIGKASGVLNTAGQVGFVTGVAAAVAIFQAAGGAGASATASGLRAAMVLAAAAATMAALAAASGCLRARQPACA